MIIDQTIVNFAVYENNKEYMGIVDVTLPDLDFLTASISGAGIAGTIEAVIPGHINAMSATFNFRTTTAETLKLASPDRHEITLLGARQDEDSVNGITIVPIKHVLVVIPKSYKGGKLAPASTSDASGEYTVRRWEMYVDGEEIVCVDPHNYKCVIDGVDYCASTRAAIGK